MPVKMKEVLVLAVCALLFPFGHSVEPCKYTIFIDFLNLQVPDKEFKQDVKILNRFKNRLQFRKQ